jgi:hypothetical protein
MRKVFLVAALLAGCAKSSAPAVCTDACAPDSLPADVTAVDAGDAVTPADAPSAVTP